MNVFKMEILVKVDKAYKETIYISKLKDFRRMSDFIMYLCKKLSIPWESNLVLMAEHPHERNYRFGFGYGAYGKKWI